VNLAPLNGIGVGILLILFRKNVCSFLEKSYDRFPKHEEGVKMLNLKFSLRPGFIVTLGVIIMLFSIAGFIVSL
jgi:hypothetical protein